MAWLWRDLDLEGGFYRYTAKGGKERQRALPPPVNWAIQAYAQAAGLARKPEEAVFLGRWRDQPVDGKYIGEQLRQAADLAVHRRRNRYSQTSKVSSTRLPTALISSALTGSALTSSQRLPAKRSRTSSAVRPACIGARRGGRLNP